jgi:hypothetical protein
MWKKPENPLGAKGLCTQIGMNGKHELEDAISIHQRLLHLINPFLLFLA